MKKLPFIIPEEDFLYNLNLVLNIVHTLPETSTGKKVLNLDRILIYFYLIRNPIILNRVSKYLQKGSVILSQEEGNSIAGSHSNLDDLFDREKLKMILKQLIVCEYINVDCDEKLGILYSSSPKGSETVIQNQGEHLLRVLDFFNLLKKFQSLSISKIEKAVSANLRG